MNVYDFTVTAQDGSEAALSDHRGKVLLIVSTAAGCGFTPRYDELQDLYEPHQKDGPEILDFPFPVNGMKVGEIGSKPAGVLCGRRPDTDERDVIVTLIKNGGALKEKALHIPEKLGGCAVLEPQKAKALYELIYEVIGQLTKN